MNIAELDKDTLAKLGLENMIDKPAKERKQTPKDVIRGHASAVMGLLSKHSQADRKRILDHAIRMNEV